jgi:outer membrane protein OmpA-like peptidoglycan-associated protein
METLGDRVLVQNLRSVNTPYIEFSPTYYREGIVFVTSRQRGGLYDPKLNTTYFELFYAKLNKDGNPYKPKPFSLEINTKYHEGPVSFSANAEQMFFSRNDVIPQKKKRKEVRVAKNQLYAAQRGEYDWENIQPLPFNDPAFNFMHPSISADGEKLYFVSDRPGGFGGYDIYVADKIDGKWMAPINLGPEINTPANEVFPFIHPTGVLFFSSNGHSGFGGLDLFLIDISQRVWGEIVNLGKSFNSPEDDFGLNMNATGTQGFFSSNREGGEGKDDLYVFNAPNGLEGVKVARQILARISVKDIETGAALMGTKIRVFEKAPDGSPRNGDLYEVELQPSSGTASSGFSIVERRRSTAVLGAPEATVGADGFAILSLDPKEQYLLFLEKEGYHRQEIDLNIDPSQSFYPIEVLLEKNDCITLRGRLRSEGYNKAVPNATLRIASSCSEEVVVLRSNTEGDYEYCLEPNCQYLITAIKVGFEPQTQDLSTERLGSSRSFSVNFTMPPAKISSTTPEARNILKEGTTIYLEGIAYDFNKSAIRKGAARDLEALAALLKRYPSIQIEVGAHTDSRGTSEYNLALSQTRALYAQDFLIEQGVHPDRIFAKGYGETKLRNECSDGVACDERQHAYNRRIEVKVLKINETVDLDAFNQAIKRN